MSQDRKFPLEAERLAAQLRKPSGPDATLVAGMMEESNRRFYDAVIPLLDLRPGQKLLEIGMGNGHHIPKLFEIENDIEYTGVDYSEEMISLAAKGLPDRLISNTRFEHGDILTINLPANEYDTIFFVNVLYFFDEVHQSMKKIQSHLKPGGKMVIGIRSRESMEKLPFTAYHFRLYSAEDLHKVLQDADFSAIRVENSKESVYTPDGRSFEMENLFGIALKPENH